MKISVFGTGYVGLVTGVCFAEMGNDVICADIDAGKIEKLKGGTSPIYEPGLDALITNNIKESRIHFTTDLKKAVLESDLLFIAVGTPSDVDGSADLKYVLQVAETIAEHMDGYKVIVNKSTVPVGTFQKVKKTVADKLAAMGKSMTFDVVSNPEFLREGCAIEDCLKPNRVVVGVETEKAATVMRKLYDSFLKSGNPLLVMDPFSSEMTKYAANSMLAAKISIMNEFSRVCEKVGADIEQVRRGIGSDFRIGPHFIFAGVGYGGSCFPKDVKALIKAGTLVDEDLQILKAVEDTNTLQRKNFFRKVQSALKLSQKQSGSSGSTTIAVWGAAFKPGTDDIREAPAIDLMKWMLAEGYHVQAFDPVAKTHALQELSHPNVTFKDNQYDVCVGADLLVIVTEWKSFREPNFAKIKASLKSPVIVDGRNIYNPADMKSEGISYYSIGRRATEV